MKKITKIFRINIDEWNKIESNIKKVNMNFSEYAREILTKGKVINPKVKNDKKNLVFELNKIGNNLNQIAKYTNEKKAIDLQVLKQITEIKKELNELL